MRPKLPSFRSGLPIVTAVALSVLLYSCETREYPAATPTTAAPSAVGPPVQLSEEESSAAIQQAEPAPSEERRSLEPEIFVGSGELVRAPLPNGPALEGGQVTLNFAGADIREVVDVLLADTLNVSYTIDPAVEGSVTVRTSEPIDRSDVIPLLETILSQNNAALVIRDGLYLVRPSDVAATQIRRPFGAGGAPGRGFGINIIPLRFASAEALSEVLDPFIGVGRSLKVDKTRNLLIYTGTAAEADDLSEMVSMFDVDWMSGMSFGLYPLSVGDPEDIVDELEEIFTQGEGEGLAGSMRFVPIERLGAVLVISPQASYLQQAGAWIKRLDRSGEGSGRRIFVYFLQNSNAVEIADILSRIFSLSSTTETVDRQGVVAPGLTPTQISAEAPAADTTEEAQEPAFDVESALATRETGVVGTLATGGDIRVIADEKKNALVILATAGEYRMIEATLARLDVQPLQVLIEATIAEVGLMNELEYGLEWFFNSGNVDLGFSSLDDFGGSAVFPGFNFVFSGSDTNVVLRALSEITDINVVSSPSLMVLDNETARLVVGDEVPIATSSQQGDTADALTVNEIQFRETGVILEVTPRVNTGGLVVLNIVQEVSTPVLTDTSDIDSPTIQQRRIESSVAVHSGETIALGGLIEDNQSQRESGIPILSEIPVLGNLFKTTAELTERTELLVLITPRVVTSREDARSVTQELRERLTTILPLQDKARLKQKNSTTPTTNQE